MNMPQLYCEARARGRQVLSIRFLPRAAPPTESLFALTRLELLRLLSWRRWLALTVLLVIVGVLVTQHLQRAAVTYGFAINAWDIPLDAFNNIVVVCAILMPLLVGLIGDVVLADRGTGYAALSPAGGRLHTSRWLAKAGAVYAATFLFFLLASAIVLLVGIVLAGPAASLSEYGQSVPELGPLGSFKTYLPPPVPELPVVGVLLVVLWTATAVGSLIILIIAVSSLSRLPWIPLALTLATVLVGLRVQATSALHPLVHLTWGVHDDFPGCLGVLWPASLIAVIVELLVATGIGSLGSRRRFTS